MRMMLLVDIGNTSTHLGFSRGRRVFATFSFPTSAWTTHEAEKQLRAILETRAVNLVALCSVVPLATERAVRLLEHLTGLTPEVLTARRLKVLDGLKIDYPKPDTIGTDRLANAWAAWALYGAPVVAVDFGTATTFDVVERQGRFVGGIIAPGLRLMTDYLHERTAQLPRVKPGPVRRFIGRNTEEAMRVAAVCGYEAMVRALLNGIRSELRVRRLCVVATGGDAATVARRVPEITALRPRLTLEGLARFGSAVMEAECRVEVRARSGKNRRA